MKPSNMSTVCYSQTVIVLGCFAVTAKLISAFVFATWIVQFLFFLNPNFKLLTIFCSCTDQFVSHLFGNPRRPVFLRRCSNSSLHSGSESGFNLVICLIPCSMYKHIYQSQYYLGHFRTQFIFLHSYQFNCTIISCFVA